MTKIEEAFRSLKVIFIGLISLILLSQASGSFPYYGTKIGALKRLHHGVSGDVYAVDSRTIFIKNFNYDGEAPAAYFYVGHTNKPSNEGAFRLRDERGATTSLTRRYRNKDITLSLPEGKTLRDIKWFSVWCDEFAVNFGDVSIPNSLDYPRPQKITNLKGVHGVSSDNIVIVDAQTLLVPNFSYDGEAPDAKFWVGRGDRPSTHGLRIPDENGKEDPLRRYDRKTIVLTLPADLTIFDIGHFGVWCEAFTVDFGHVRIPEGLNVPPSLKMLGISPQSKLNCEVLYDDLAYEVRWAVAGESIVIQLVAKLDPNAYMAFGISPSKERSEMIGSDVVVSWVDRETGKGYAQDYYLSAKSQCSGGVGSCPDINIEDNTNSIRLLNAAMVNGYSIVTYQRSLHATDRLDLPISVNESESIVWAIGPLNERNETSFHEFFNKKVHHINFGRQPVWNCPMPEGLSKSSATSDEDDTDDDTTIAATGVNASQQQQDPNKPGYPPARTTTEPEEEFYDNRAQALQKPNRRQGSVRPVPTPKPTTTVGAWDIPAIQCYEPEDGVFYAQMGPTGGKHGYTAITGHVGWGISWYINGLLIPEIHVVRGKTYTFVVEGGNNPDTPAKYHPFYITDDPVGGFEHKLEEEKKNIRIFAGVHRSRNGQITPIGVGRLCNWTPDVDGPLADEYQSFGAYQRTLTLKCDPGEPGVITWKPDRNTPDTVYYHCFTHRYLGWKIHVHDSCDDARYAASVRHEIRLPANIESEDFDAQSSIRHETKVSPNDNFLLKHQTDLIKNHNMNGTPPKLSFEITKSSEITKLISDGIRAAEALEESIIRNNNGNNSKPPSIGSQTSKRTKINAATAVGTGAPSLPIQHQVLAAVKRYPDKIFVSNSIIPYAQANLAQSPPNSLVPPNKHANNFHLQHHNAPPLHFYYHHPHHHQSNNLTNLPENLQKTIGLSEYLRPPQNSPLFHPVKLPGRRPIPGPIKKNSQIKPILPRQRPQKPQIAVAGSIPQPAVVVGHYRKPLPGLFKQFLSEKPIPIQPMAASVLLLGQPSELAGQRRKNEQPVLHSHKHKPVIPVPYSDEDPQDSLKANIADLKPDKKKPHLPIKIPNKIITKESINSPPPAVFKEPFDIHEAQNEPPSSDIATMKPAVNKGFIPDSVVVEGGFRPIVRADGIHPKIVEQTASRREDPGTEIDEVMETDTLFLTAQTGTQNQNFEPMFIPSPPDSTNETLPVQPIKPASNLIDRKPIASSNLPEMAPLRNVTLEDLFEELGSMVEGEEVVNLATNSESTTTKKADNFTEVDTGMKKNYTAVDLEQLFDDEENFEFEEDDPIVTDEADYSDREAQAAERIDTYYLPPDNRKIPHAQIPSGAVVTFDGKKLIDSTLVLPPKLDARDLSRQHLSRDSSSTSKIEELIRTTPQFVPFRGEIPPSIPDFLSTEKALQLKASPISESVPSTLPPTFPSPASVSSLRPISTKLALIKNST